MSAPSQAALRQAALHDWDNALEVLDGSFHAYADRTSSLFKHFGNEAEQPGDPTGENTFTIEDALQHIDSRLERLQKLETELHNARIALQGLRNTSTVLSPIGRLPPELISHIIVLGHEEDRLIKAAKNVHIDDEELPVDENGDEIVEPDPPHFPSLVSHVCKRWRQIALDTGKLWSTIDFHEGPPYEKTREWLVRSKDSPNLELILDVEDPVSKLSSSEKLEEVLVLIEPHAPRISSLYARTSTIADLVHVLVHLTDTTKPLPLKSLALLVDEVDSSLMDHQELQGKQLMLRDMLAGLDELELEKVHLPWSYITLRGLRKLRLSTLNVDEESPTAQHIYQLLTDCPQIEMINLDGVDIGGSDALIGDGVAPIKLPHLSDLFLTQLEWSPARFLLSIIDAPSLSYLRIVDMELLEDSPTPRKLISNFFNKISPTSLRTIRVEESQFGDSDLMGMISASRALQELHIVDCAVTNKLLTFLEGKEVVPLLDSIKLDSISSIDSEALKKFVTARQASDHPLKQIAIKYCRIEPEVHEWLATMVPDVIWETDSDASGSDIDDEEGAETTDGEDVLDVDMIDGELDDF